MLGLFKLKLTNFRIKMGFTLDSFSSNSERWKNAISRRRLLFDSVFGHFSLIFLADLVHFTQI